MNAIVPANFGAVSTKFQQAKFDNDLATGIQAGFGLIGYKGKVWSIRYRGEDLPLMRDDGDGPRNSIEVVILKGAPYVSKIWYEKGYVEGSNAPPDCFSPNGQVPDPQSTKKQASVCASCPQNQWGSRLSDAGKKGKACSDSKRLAVVPMGDIANETYGGPMLLRVPAASLQDLATYGNKMQNLGYPYFAVATRISFDSNEAFPKFVFNAIRPLDDDEAEQVLALQPTEEVKRVLAEGAELAAAPPVAAEEEVANAFEQAPAAKPAATKPAAQKPAQKAAEQPPETASAAPKKAAGGFGPVGAATKADDAPKVAAKPATKTTAKPATKPVAKAPPVIPDEDEEVTAAAGLIADDDEAAGEDAAVEESDFEKSLDEQLAALLPD